MVLCVSNRSPCNRVRIPPFVKEHGPISDFDILTHTSHIAFEKHMYSSIKGKYNSIPPVKHMFLKKDGIIFFRSVGPQLHQTASPLAQFIWRFGFIRVGISTSTPSTLLVLPSSIPLHLQRTIRSYHSPFSPRKLPGAPEVEWEGQKRFHTSKHDL